MSFGVNFTGAGVSKKRLNFASDNDTVSSAIRIAKLREEREKRERERLRNSAATILQRFQRGLSARQAFRVSEKGNLLSALERGDVRQAVVHGCLYFRRSCVGDEDGSLFAKLLRTTVNSGGEVLGSLDSWNWTTLLRTSFSILIKCGTGVESTIVAPVDVVTALRTGRYATAPLTEQGLALLGLLCQQGPLSLSPLGQELVERFGSSPLYLTIVLSQRYGHTTIQLSRATEILDQGANLSFEKFSQSQALHITGSMLHCLESAQGPASAIAFLTVFKKATSIIPANLFVAEILRKGSLLHGLLQTKNLHRILMAIQESSQERIQELCLGLQKMMSYCCSSRDSLMQTVTLVSRIAMAPGLLHFLWEKVKTQKMDWDLPTSTLFLDLYNYYLETVDDDRTFDADVAVSKSDALMMIQSLRDHITCQRSLQDCAAVNALSRLHVIDERMPFSPPGSWAFPVNSTLLITSSVAAISFEEYLTFDHTKACSKRVLYALKRIPFGIAFPRRAALFYNFMHDHAERVQRQLGAPPGGFNAFHGSSYTVNRRQIFEDGYKVFNHIDGAQIFDRARVHFVNDDGEVEAGFGDGVFKEFVVELCKAAFSVDHGLFKTSPDLGIYPNPHSAHLVGPHHVDYFRFLGRLLGKAIFEKILVDIPFAKFFRNCILGRTNTFSDLAPFDPELHRNLRLLRDHDGDVEADFSLNFCVSDAHEIYGGTVQEIPLIPNGRTTPVTNDNRTKYVLLAAHYKLNTQIRVQTDAFREGLGEVIPLPALQMFDPNELQMLFQGEEGDRCLDIEDWMAHTTYNGGYFADHPTIQMFWRLVLSFTAEQQRALLKFATSVPRAPLLGFKHMVPPFNVVRFGEDATRLPSAATCMSTLKLPPYHSEAVMREKLIYAITNANSFELS